MELDPYLKDTPMIPLLDKVLEEIRKLPEAEQEAIAELILSKSEPENELLAHFKALLLELAEEALKEHRAGKTKTLDLVKK
jgi:hypothetical protein